LTRPALQIHPRSEPVALAQPDRRSAKGSQQIIADLVQRIVVQALHATLAAMRAGTPSKDILNLPAESFVRSVTRDADYTRWTSEMLGGKDKG